MDLKRVVRVIRRLFAERPDGVSIRLSAEELFFERRMLQNRLHDNAPPQSVRPENQESDFINQFIAVVLDHYDNPDFDTTEAAKYLQLSRMHLHRKVRSLTGCSPGNIIRRCRFQTACLLLRKEQFDITTIAHAVGFRSASHFTKGFRREYGESPSQYKRNILTQSHRKSTAEEMTTCSPAAVKSD